MRSFETVPKFNLDNSMQAITKSRNARIINENNVPSSLSALENEILTLKTNLQRNIWLLGQRLAKIRDDKLYENEENPCNSFDEYCEIKLDFSRAVAYRFIKIYETFDFVSTSRHDYSKLEEVAKVKDIEKRSELLEKIEKEKLSVRKIREIVKETNSNKEKKIDNDLRDSIKLRTINNQIIVDIINNNIKKDLIVNKIKMALKKYL